MKTILTLLLSSLAVLGPSKAKADSMRDAITVTSAVPVSLICLVAEDQMDGTECAIAAMLSSATVLGVLLKEIQEVRPDAFAYDVDGIISPALMSVVEKIQIEAQRNGQELSFEEVINFIATI